MRIEQIIATVSRRLAIAEVRVISVVESFAVALRLHLWLLRTSEGMPSYPAPAMHCLRNDRNTGGWLMTGALGCKRGKQQMLPAYATAGCPAGLITA